MHIPCQRNILLSDYVLAALLAACALIPTQLAAALKDIAVKSESAILVNRETGAILYEKNAHTPLYPASITKIATVAYALRERGAKWDKLIAADHNAVASVSEVAMERSKYTLPAHWLTTGACHVGIKKGEQLSLKDLCYGTMLPSGGDAANVIADYIGGTIPAFMQLLNAYVRELGCRNTEFKNPHGLHHPQHLTTAYDMSLIAMEAMKDPRFREIVSSVRYTRPQTNKQNATTFVQTNALLKKGKHYYSKATGIKTGYTSKAQKTLVASAKDGERELIAVLMKCKERDDLFSDARRLFEEAFKEKKIEKTIFPKGLQKFAFQVPVYIKNAISISFYPSEAPQVNYSLLWNPVELPIEKDQPVGTLSFKDQKGNLIAQETLFAAEKLDYSFGQKIKRRLQAMGAFRWAILAAVLLLSLFFSVYRKRRCS